MARYIDADALRHNILYFADAKNLNGNHEQAKAYNHCLIMIDESKTVEVVRCRDCIHHQPFPFSDEHICDVHNWKSKDEDFCSFAERRTQ